MLFNSYVFILIFLPVTAFGFYLIGRSPRPHLAIAWLVLASLFFYGWWNPKYLALIVASMLVNYSLGIRLSQLRKTADKNANLLLAAGITLNLVTLAYFKYANFFVDNINLLFSTQYDIGIILLPIAISFFTFQQIAYLVDARRGEAHEYNFLHYCLFITFFPQLIAGPIVHHKEMLPQFERQTIYQFSYRNLAVGLSIFTIGLFKKVIIADNIALTATPIFQAAETGQSISLLESWGAALAYTFQLYFDFSGYADMAIGAARMFGIRLPLNFHSPYKSVNIVDFWRRWHMTLSRFLRDYLYFALGGNRKGKFRRYVNLLVTMLLGGLWHGAGWTFVLWGALHGFYLIINHLWLSVKRTRQPVWWRTLTAQIITFIAVVVGWVFFRAESLEGAGVILKGMIGLNGIILPEGKAHWFGPLLPGLQQLGVQFDTLRWLGISDIIILLVLWIAVLTLPNTQEIMARYRPSCDFSLQTLAKTTILRFSTRPAWAMGIAIMAILSLLSLNKVSEFLYFQF